MALDTSGEWLQVIDDHDVFVSAEEEQIEQIRLSYRCIRVAIITLASGFCTMIAFRTIVLIINHW